MTPYQILCSTGPERKVIWEELQKLHPDGIDMRYRDFRGAWEPLNCKNVDFSHCKFNKSILSRSTFTDCEFDHAEFDWPLFDKSQFYRCSFVGATFTDITHYHVAFFNNCNFRTSVFRDSCLDEVVFAKCDFTESLWDNLNVVESRFIGCTFPDTDIVLPPAEKMTILGTGERSIDLPFAIHITHDSVQVGCKKKSIKEWMSFTKEEFREKVSLEHDFYLWYLEHRERLQRVASNLPVKPGRDK